MKRGRESRHQRKVRVPKTLLLAGIIAAATVSAAQAQGSVVRVKLLFEEGSWAGCSDDGFSAPDIYWNVSIDGVSKRVPKDDEITDPFDPFGYNSPLDIEIFVDVDLSKGTIPIVVEQKDADLNADDTCDIDPGSDKALDLTLDLENCQFTGDVSGNCDETIRVPPFFDLGPGKERGTFEFRISVEKLACAARSCVRCLHTPIWPQPGETVTIRAEALDDAADPVTVPVDDIEIWIDDTSAPIATTSTTPGREGDSIFTYYDYLPPSGADQLLYRCHVTHDGETASTGWRIVQIGQPAKGRAVPISYTGYQTRRIDVVFLPDEASYTGPDDVDFLDDVRTAIRDGLYAGRARYRKAGRFFLGNQNTFNLWIGLDPGNYSGVSLVERRCFLTPPGNWGSKYAFADVGVILHENSGVKRECSETGQRIASVKMTGQADDLAAVFHELGHVPFGLADEYCCDGSYSAIFPFPNVYDSQRVCLDDPLADRVPDACQPIGDPDDHYRLDPASTYLNDLMTGFGDVTPRPADIRRIDWVLGRCGDEDC